MKKILAVLLCLLALPITLHAQSVTVSGTNVRDSNGVLLASGQWCFNATCLTVTAGGFSGTVTSGTSTVTVVNASSTTILTATPVTISANYSWNTFVVPQSITFTGNGVPYLACQLAASYIQEDSTPVGKMWNCISNTGQLQWSASGYATPVGPGIVSGFGAPTITGIVPTVYVRTDNNISYTLNGVTGSISNNWTQLTSYFPGSGDVAISGTPSAAGQAPVSTSTSAAGWQYLGKYPRPLPFVISRASSNAISLPFATAIAIGYTVQACSGTYPCIATSSVPATASSTVTFAKNGTTFCTVTFAIGGTVGTFSGCAQTSFTYTNNTTFDTLTITWSGDVTAIPAVYLTEI